MRGLAVVCDELVGRHPNDLSVLPFDHRQAKTLVSNNRVIDGLTHGCHDVKALSVDARQLGSGRFMVRFLLRLEVQSFGKGEAG